MRTLRSATPGMLSSSSFHPSSHPYPGSRSLSSLNLVHSWLEDHGVPSSVSMMLGGDWLMVIGVPLPQVGASYQLYQHVEMNDTVLRTLSYSLSDALQGHIQTVVPTTFFGSPRTQWKIPRILPRSVAAARTKTGSEELVTARHGEKISVMPSYLRWLYKTVGYAPASVDQNAIATAGYAVEHPSPQDLSAFMTEYRTDGEDATFTVTQANLDLQYAEALTYPKWNIFYSTGGRLNTARDPYLNWLIYLLNLETIPRTISTTYGGPYVMFSSGGWGAGQGDCLVRSSNGQVSVQFLPEFPASCPWVTSVGGTTSDHSEIAAILSGGGFSNYFPRPYHQEIAVPLFLQDVPTYTAASLILLCICVPYGRDIPDISAQALNFEIVIDGEFEEVDGTSGSAFLRLSHLPHSAVVHPRVPSWPPNVQTVAGTTSLLNDYRLSKGKHALGFRNPWLYSFGLPGLNDITLGSNPGCRTDGFPAVAGWDHVTGLGMPDFDKLKNIIDEEK
ncbi:subtilisin-like protein [Lactarius akahatsu]|uniref:Subtilisin-like protein n=1 Tax=Lactarius akahatsu TaxID=416441 RepID=A0AAD4Q909_9AGAM|nr:subtilisin-like protein [Lactarius akahatsu]